MRSLQFFNTKVYNSDIRITVKLARAKNERRILKKILTCNRRTAKVKMQGPHTWPSAADDDDDEEEEEVDDDDLK
jgi:hypothetical protein